jgi:hypothetical protein
VLFFLLPVAMAQNTVNAQATLDTSLKDYSQALGQESSSLLNLPVASGFDLPKIMAYVIFGTIGFSVFLYGKKQVAFKPMIIGILLMGYPYFISGTLAVYLIGVALLVLLYLVRQ